MEKTTQQLADQPIANDGSAANTLPTEQQIAQGLAVARAAAGNAYAPYSQFRVGAALRCQDGQMISGCNVENASYGLTICAERNALATAIAQGQRQFAGMVVYTPLKTLVAPCGACRQVIAEFFAPNAVVTLVNDYGDSRHFSVEELLPAAFTPSDLNKE